MSNYIDDELLASILKRLPVEALMRCRCVCNSWKQLIASKWFVLDHLAVQTPCLIAQNYSRDYAFLDPRTLPSYHSFKTSVDQFLGRTKRHFIVVGGVHGVICLFNNCDRLFLWNPAIHRCFRVPVPQTWISQKGAGLKYCGFWIDPSNNDFKIVLFRLGRYRMASLLSSTKPAWTEVDAGCIRSCYSSNFDTQQVLIGGVAHWVICTDQSYISKAILFFDFGDEKLGEIEFPEPVRVLMLSGSRRDEFNICKWKESLSVVHWKQGQTGSPNGSCDLWTMQNGSWRKIFSFNLMNEVWIWKVHTMLEDCGKLLVSGMHPDTDYELMYYEPKHGCTLITSNFWGSTTSLAFDFVESLVFPDPICVSTI